MTNHPNRSKQQQAQHTSAFSSREVSEALSTFIKTGSANGNEPLRLYCYRTVPAFAAAPEIAAERDRLKALNAELLAALNDLDGAIGLAVADDFDVHSRDNIAKAIVKARAAIAKYEGL